MNEPHPRDRLEYPPEDEIERQRWVTEAEARLFGGVPAPVRIGRFEVRERLGQGGLGVVWAAHDPALDRLVALKLLHAEGAGASDTDGERILVEARAMARLAHPHVVTVYEVGEHEGGRIFLAMELVDGWTLRTWLREVGPGWREVVGALIDAGRGLAAAHRAGLVHRDFKPENVLVGRDGRVRVADFGLARPASAPPVSGAAPPGPGGDATSIAGTLAYMAPEQRAGRTATPAADQFAFCVAMYEALHGRRPFPEGPLEVAGRPDERAGVSRTPRRIESALRRGLSSRPGDRWPSMDALVEELEGAQRGGSRPTLAAVAVAIAIAVALIAAVMQVMMFSDWIGAMRKRNLQGPAATAPPG